MEVNGDCKVNRVCHVNWDFLLLRNRQPDPLETWWGFALAGSLWSVVKWSRSSAFWIFNEFFVHFGGNLKKSSSAKLLGQLLRNCIGTLLGGSRPQFVQQMTLWVFFIFLLFFSWIFVCFCYRYSQLFLQNRYRYCAGTLWKCCFWRVNKDMHKVLFL